jgi:LuxR family maltose regulon positive regulatory protein
MPDTLLITKLLPPPSRERLVKRQRLLQQLELESERKLTLVSAPAGYGKTSLLASWVASSEHETAWLTLDPTDNIAGRYTRYLVASVGRVRTQLETDTPDRLLNALSEGPPLVLVLDDYHHLDAPEAHALTLLLLERSPPQLHLIISTRVDPPLPLAKLRVRGELSEIRSAELRFTSEELASFLKSMDLTLSRGDSTELLTRTEGWAAGLQLAALSLQGREDVGGFIERFTGTDRYVLDYLTEEVIMRQSQEIQDFLALSSILERLNGDLCQAVTGQVEAQARLEELEMRNLFVVALDDERRWYRYHPFFQDLLKQRLTNARPDLLPILHRRASNWYEQHGSPSEAFRHALSAHDYRAAAELVSRHQRTEHIRRVVLSFLHLNETSEPLEVLLQQAHEQGLPFEVKSRLIQTFAFPEKAKDVDYGWLEPLSERELEIVQLLATGLSNKAIARHLDISLNTVKTHTKNAYSKLEVGSRTQAIAKAQELGLI